MKERTIGDILSSHENTSTMIADRAYRRLLMSILQKSHENLILSYLDEVQSCTIFRVGKKVTLDTALEDSRKYVLYYQSGSCVLVLKDSPLGKQIVFGKKKKEKKD